MSIRVVYSGIIGGVIAAVSLAAPLYLSFPSLYTTEWTSLDSSLTGICSLIAGAVVVASGYAAAQWSWAASRVHAVGQGAAAGLLASLVAYLLIGSSAVGIAGVGLILQRGIAPVAVENQGMPLLTESVVRVLWYTYLFLWGSAAVGTFLGALGGVFAAHKTWGSRPTAENTLLQHMFAIFTLVASSLNLVVTSSLTSSLAERAKTATVELGITPSLPTAGFAAWPLATVALLFLTSIWWNWRWIGLRLSESTASGHRAGRRAAMFTVVVPSMSVVLLFLVVADTAAQPLIVAALCGVVALTVFGIRSISRKTSSVAIRSLTSMPQGKDFLKFGILLWLMVVLQLLLGIVNLAITLVYGVIDFISVLTQPTTVPDALLSAPQAINNIFSMHLMLPLVALAAPVVIVPLTWLYYSLRLRARRPEFAPSH